MGVRAGVIAFVVGLWTVACAAVILPAVAAAELVEEDRCGLLPAAILPQPVWAFEPGETVRAPEVGFTYSPGPETTPPLSAFMVSASWGDGTTTPVTLQQPIPGCYRLGDASHVYTSPGLYPFSYHVRDGSSGLEHVFQQHQLRIWDPTPHPLAGPARVLHILVGTEWNGVVGEFSVESPWNSSFYTAEIEPELGKRQQATITGGNEHLVVSATLAYSQPFTGAVNVVLSRLKRPALGTWRTLSVVARRLAKARIHGRSTLVARGSGRYELVFRVSGALPQTRRAHVAATLEAAGETPPVAAFGRHRSRHCYYAALDAASVNPALSAGRLPFTLVIGSQGLEQREAVAVRTATTSARAAGRQLGC